MNFYDYYTDALEKVAGRREKHYADALKSPEQSGFSTIPDFMRGGRTHLTRADVHKEYLKEHKEYRPIFAAHVAEAMVTDHTNRMKMSEDAHKHHSKNHKKSDRKASSILNRGLLGGANRKAKHSRSSKHHEGQAKAHLDNYHHSYDQTLVHSDAVSGIDSGAGGKTPLTAANAYMKKHFS